MPEPNIFSDYRLFPSSKIPKTPSGHLAAFEKALSSCIRAWSKYQPNDSLAADRKQDLEWLQSTLRDYRLNIHPSSNSREFWNGCTDGKRNRRTLGEKNSKSIVQILIEAIAFQKAQKIYELGVQVGWRYARLKDYLLRIRKQRKLEQAQQIHDYQQFLNFYRQKTEPEETESLLSFGRE
ncbi:MAG TPA: hypothetical protein DDW76_05530 [Cyanobacteria bacterium UBA11369]|nr:hypothetical protein [Cyanobacteria bacterium UBA11371]HBE36691.1 hypothetical protein [Cyanobacteria bacterium UBA11368]HBE48268.1 hypothetical protein [Cyanobacteria bacterium UBA11369]